MKNKTVKVISSLIMLGLVVILTSSCEKTDDGNHSLVTIPVLKTAAIRNIALNTASSGGTVTNYGGSVITAKGVCWSTIHNPTIADNKTSDGTDTTSNFTSNLDGLLANTTYYVRSYVTNSAGTGYGDEVSFITGAVADIDGNIYHAVTIGNQVWMVENLKTTKYSDGKSIPNVSSQAAWVSSTTGAYCDYNNTNSNASVYGHLYNWYAATDSRKIAPTGWHVPTDEEYNTLAEFLGGADQAGGKLKEAGTTHWINPNIGATNTSGFTALADGYRDENSFFHMGYYGNWWITKEDSPTLAWFRYVAYDNAALHPLTATKSSGFGIRCIKD